MIPSVDKLNASGIPITNVNERLAGDALFKTVGVFEMKEHLATIGLILNAAGSATGSSRSTGGCERNARKVWPKEWS
jgi:hypothetical protein